MKAGWSRRQIMEAYRIGPTKLSEIRAKHKEELEGFANPNATQAHAVALEKRRMRYHEMKGLPNPKA